MKLTVLIPVYNTIPKYLEEAVLSIRAQDYGDIPRVIIIDDGSTNVDTKQKIKQLEGIWKSVETCRLDRNQGTSAALNYGHSFVDTEFVAIQGSDDYSFPYRFRKQIDYIKKNPKVDVLGGQIYGFWEDDPRRKPIFKTDHPHIPRGYKTNPNWLVNHGSVIYRQSAVLAVGGYQRQGRGQDVELWGRMSKAGYIFRNIPDMVCQWRRFR